MAGDITIRYHFLLENGARDVFELSMNPQTVEIICSENEALPPWARLDFFQCPHCLLLPDQHAFCPAASNLVSLVYRCEKLLSHDNIVLEVETPERVVSQQTSAQKAISSLIGLLMAASKCPHTAFFKPMARFHLPLASEEETVFRATASYMLAQYFRKSQDREADFSMEGLSQIYKDMQTINMAMANRIRAASKTDSSINAIIILDMYARALPYVINKSLEELRFLFTPYLAQLP